MMKKNLLFITMLFMVLTVSAQYTVSDRNGNVLNNGDIVEYGTTTYPEASYEFFVTNDGSQEIYTRIEFVSAVNTDGSLFELCYGLCYTGITIGQTVPIFPDVLTIAPGETTLEGNHFYNADPGNGSDNLDYIFSFHQLEADGTTEIGTPLTFTYRYNPTLGVNNVNKVDLTIQSTIISGDLILKVNEDLDMVVYDLQGRVVKHHALEVGDQRINMSDLRTQTYILQFRNAKGAVQTTKVIIQ